MANRKLTWLLLGALILSLCAGCSGSPRQEDTPTTITVWHVYGGQTDSPLNDFIAQFNQTVGKEQGINVTAADINILYGKDPSEILKVMGKSQQLFTVEDHNINGGLGSYISRLACENQPAKVTRIALTTYGESGPAKELADAYGFSPEAIAAKVKETLN